jgi:hypothetical protein
MEETKPSLCLKFKNITAAILVRFVLLAQIGFSIQYVVCILSSYQYTYIYLLLIINAIVIIIDGVYVCVKRNGMDYKW